MAVQPNVNLLRKLDILELTTIKYDLNTSDTFSNESSNISSISETEDSSSTRSLNSPVLGLLTQTDATTELPFYTADNDYIYNTFSNASELSTNSTSLDYAVDDSDNPFLSNDYNFYDYNENGSYRHEPYDYSEGDNENNTDEDVMALWENVNEPPRVMPITFIAYDLNPYFLVLPPVLLMCFIILLFMPCIILKWRDDIREMTGKERIYGSVKRKRSQKKNETAFRESYQAVDPEWQAGASNGSAPVKDVQFIPHVHPPVHGLNNTYDKRVAPNGIKENVLYVEENESDNIKENGRVSSFNGKLKSEPPVDYGVNDVDHPKVPSIVDTGMEVTSERHSSRQDLAEKESGDSLESSASGLERRRQKESEDSVDAGNFTTAPRASFQKFPGWNRDLYSEASGFGPSTRKGSTPSKSSPRSSGDRDWDLY